MAVRAFKDRRLGFFAGIKEKVQTIKVTGAASAHVIGTTIKPYGVTVISTTGATSTGGAKVRVSLDTPLSAGIRKSIVVNVATSAAVAVVNKSTATKFYGSTVNSFVFTRAAGVTGQGNLDLLAVSTAQWAVMNPRGTTAAAQYPYALANSSR